MLFSTQFMKKKLPFFLFFEAQNYLNFCKKIVENRIQFCYIYLINMVCEPNHRSSLIKQLIMKGGSEDSICLHKGV